ncbi:hypothetical protein [Mucisphaera calidilacus]|uniref:Uncharacterized protein n=1 Tax=Mucisphaera calidilacus TaxID=2527982 RepID=A0A518BUM1_9BACT|nr:hypothetical protein [Mucisphaera calidilacus]QDU70627.1 hypothetical protein Pan265_04550 [Mucisphaera calidilacus]
MKKQAVAKIVISLLVIAAGAYLIFSSVNDTGGIPDQAYFYDLNTQQIVLMPKTTAAPVELDSGPHNGEPAGVKARVYACNGVEELLWLERYPLHLRDKVANGPMMSAPLEVRHPDDPDGKWVLKNSPEGQELTSTRFKELRDKAGGGVPREVFP